MVETPTATAQRPPIDPRIRQRRAQVRRSAGRRRRRVVVALLGLVAVGAGAFGATRSALLDVDHVHVLGASRTPVSVVHRAGLTYGRPMVELPGDAVARLEGTPWVKTAAVRRRWPGTVVVRLTERTPAAVLPAATGSGVLVDAEGRLLEAVAEPVPGLPRLVGAPAPAGPEGMVDPVALPTLAVVGLLGPLAARVPEVRLLPGGELELGLADGGTVRFGPPTRVGEKLVAVATMLEQADLAGLATLDVRVPSSPVVTRRR